MNDPAGKIRGRRLLDIGTGPCIHSVISASKWFVEITLTDFAEPNRRELTKWWKKEEGAWDWEVFFRYVANMEGNEQKWKHDQDNIREKIQGVYFCDVAQTNPLLHKCDPFDAITSCLCLEAACPTEEAYEQAIKNVASLLKAGGFLVMVGVLGESYYAVGEYKFFALPMSQKLVTRSLEKSGFEDITWYQFDSQRKEDEDFIRTVSNYRGSFVVTATKIGDV
ncbi:nicotinamide N-methyltransferase-like [Lingula anatina]|uniref:Nicotinamide N-methyltransferase-like n=1 Tax=Lingula anatina TaxID=7574 RepID=A0A1S3IAK5_LINAN|nr:nicotinamide N-methyltransferase-like [Lingula anatina]|eukprot:XP_013394439.1 nicotinamide N-methyltransferase-like [Lingula anatina]